MNAVELKFADGKPTGLWYCGKCRHIEKGIESAGKFASEHHREDAEKCCTGATRWVPSRRKIGGNCTGCRKPFKACVCGRAEKHCCVSCGRKLFQKEGTKVSWGVGSAVAEICYQCSKIPALAKKLMDAPQ